MGRPRYEKGEGTAREKLEAAFWEALTEGSYEDVSVVGLCRAAEVNKNTFYYHFDNIDGLACAVAESLLEPEFVFAAIEAMRENAQIPDELSMKEFKVRLNRICLLADDKASPRLRCMLRDAMAKMWATKLGIDIDGLDLQGRASLEFVLGGFLGVFAFYGRKGNNFALTDIWGADYQHHALNIINALGKTDRHA